MKSKKFINVLMIILPVAAVVLTALPNCVMMKFAAPYPEPAYIEYCSGFSVLPVGYGIWGPMLAGVTSCALAIMAVVQLLYGSRKLCGWILGATVFGLVMSLTPMLFGMMTVIGWCISALLLAQTVFAFILKR